MILSLSIATVAMGTTGLSLVSPVFAGGDHHDHGEKKCKNNDDNNCNDTHKTQKIKAKNDCEIENENKDHSHDNGNVNTLTCSQRSLESERCRTSRMSSSPLTSAAKSKKRDPKTV